MNKTLDKNTVSPFQATYWKSKYEKEKLLSTSIVSLMNKFGSSLELEILQKELLLTLMGHYLTGDSCYYAVEKGCSDVMCALSYGKYKAMNLPRIQRNTQLLTYLEEHPYPVHFKELPETIFDDRSIGILSDYYSALSPLCIKSNIIGLVFLGSKISTKNYSESDYALLHQFCTLAAMTFNHAMLFQNAKLSIEELNKLNATRMDIINRITHEFRTPLTVIKAGISSLKLGDENAEVAIWINHSLSRLEHLILSLLDLNEDHSPESLTSKAEWNPVSILHEILPLHMEIASHKDITIRVQETAKEPIPQPQIPPEKFRQVLNNLIENAIKYSNESSTIEISFEEDSREPDEAKDGTQVPDWKHQFERNLSEYKDLTDINQEEGIKAAVKTNPEELPYSADESSPSYVILKITDGGIGIPSEEIKMLSQPFLQASNSPDVGVKGKGLGLTLTHKIVSSYGGKIYCLSEKGEGTTFTLFLPTK